MLQHITIQQIALIDALTIDFDQGLCIFTGETGAGKSIILDALGFVTGQRASAQLLRHGSKKGMVSAAFELKPNSPIHHWLAQQEIDAQESLLLRRVIYADGKTRAFVNDHPVTITSLREMCRHLVAIYGQHNHKGLLDPGTHRHFLDQYGGLSKELEDTKQNWECYQQAKKALQEATDNKEKNQQQADYYRYVVKELDDLDLLPGEEQKLNERRQYLAHQEQIIQSLEQSQQLLNEHDMAATVGKIQYALAQLTSYYPNLTDTIDGLERAAIEIEEARQNIQQIHINVEQEEETLESVEDRLFKIRDTAKKYQRTISELGAYHQQIKDKLNEAGEGGDYLAALKKQQEHAKKAYDEKATLLHNKRIKIAKKLELEVNQQCKPLKLEHTQFNIQIMSSDQGGPYGSDKIEFMATTNPGMPAGPLAQIASGGELSRFMLALTVILHQVNPIPTLIFDEVDSGIGGAVADAVGQRLADIAKKSQILVVTHQPQVAGKGNWHSKVAKNQNQAVTTTHVVLLSKIERQEELARMLAGEDITNEARAAALRLMQPALEEAS